MLDRLTYSFYNSMQLFSKANGASEDKVEINLDKHMLTSPLLKEILVAEEENFKDFKKNAQTANMSSCAEMTMWCITAKSLTSWLKM